MEVMNSGGGGGDKWLVIWHGEGGGEWRTLKKKKSQVKISLVSFMQLQSFAKIWMMLFPL